jgi:hypothetical protein
MLLNMKTKYQNRMKNKVFKDGVCEEHQLSLDALTVGRLYRERVRSVPFARESFYSKD